MSFIAKNPLSIPEITTSPSTPQGTRGLFAKPDGLYELDSEGKESKLATAYEVYTKEEIDDYFEVNTPVKGVDYWTEEDKAEIKSDVAPFDVNISIANDGSITSDKTFEEIVSAYNEGKVIQGFWSDKVLTLVLVSPTTVTLLGVINNGFRSFYCTQSNIWQSDLLTVVSKEHLEDNYIADTDYATSEKAGVVKVNSTKSTGINFNENNVLQVACAVPNDIDKKVDPFKPIVPRFLEYSVQVCTNQDSEAELTEDQLKLPPSTQYLKDVVSKAETTKLNIDAGVENEGKFLRVVDGKAAWVAIQNAEEVTF